VVPQGVSRSRFPSIISPPDPFVDATLSATPPAWQSMPSTLASCPATSSWPSTAGHAPDPGLLDGSARDDQPADLRDGPHRRLVQVRRNQSFSGTVDLTTIADTETRRTRW
jgi:hypothetical protein